MPIPATDPATGNLPPGDHYATLDEVKARFATTMRKRDLFRALQPVLIFLKFNGVKEVVLDGSYINDHEQRPSDIDVWYEAPPSVDPSRWGELAPQNRRQLKKSKGVDLCKHPMKAGSGDPTPLPEFWRTDRNNHSRGLIWITL